MTSSESNNSVISGNNIHDNWYGIFVNIADTTHINNNNLTKNNIAISLFNSTSTNITANYINDNQAGITHHQSSNTLNGNNITNNAIVNIQEVDTTGVVMQSNIWNCGPASLTTVLNRMGINATQEDIADLAGTDKEGTSMWGLVNAAQQYDMLNSTGMIVPVDQLQANNIVLLTMAGLYHFSVITNITNGTVFLADSAFGNINMSIENFTAMYSGYVIVITNTSTNNVTNSTPLSMGDLQTIKAASGEALGHMIGRVVATVSPTFRIPVVGQVVAVYTGVLIVGMVAGYYYQGYMNSLKPHTYTIKESITLNSGYKYTKKYTKTKTTTNKYSKLGSGYVSPTKGYTPTPTVNPADVIYQRTYDQYNDQKTSEFNKIKYTLQNQNTTDRQTSLCEFWDPIVTAEFYAANGPLGGNPEPKPEEISRFFNNLYKSSKEMIRTGCSELNAGNYAKGLTYITIGTGGFNLWGSTLFSYLVYEIWPEGLGPLKAK